MSNVIYIHGTPFNPSDGTEAIEDADPNTPQFYCEINLGDGDETVKETLTSVVIAGFTSGGNFRCLTNKMTRGQLLEILELVKKEVMST